MSQQKYIIFQKKPANAPQFRLTTFARNTKIIQYLWYNLYLSEKFFLSIVCHHLCHFTMQLYLWAKVEEREKERDKKKRRKIWQNYLKGTCLTIATKTTKFSHNYFVDMVCTSGFSRVECFLVNFIGSLILFSLCYAKIACKVNKNYGIYASCSLFTWSLMSILRAKRCIISESSWNAWFLCSQELSIS